MEAGTICRRTHHVYGARDDLPLHASRRLDAAEGVDREGDGAGEVVANGEADEERGGGAATPAAKRFTGEQILATENTENTEEGTDEVTLEVSDNSVGNFCRVPLCVLCVLCGSIRR